MSRTTVLQHTMIGQMISRYCVLETLGESGHWLVYKAEDLERGRTVVLKLLAGDVVPNPAALERFHYEARTVAALNHPNICTIYEAGEHEGRVFVAMELLEGEKLSRILAGNPLDLHRILLLAAQIVDGLEAAHEAGVVHSDIMPATIFVMGTDQVKLLDFGMAALMPRQTASPGRPLAHAPTSGSEWAAYTSPEIIRGEEVDRRSDLFSLGAVLYEMATGHRAFAGSSNVETTDAILNSQPQPMREIEARIPQSLDRLVTKALDKDPKRRFQTALDFAAALETVKQELENGIVSSAALVQVSPPVAPVRDRKRPPPTRWHRFLVGGVAASVILLLIFMTIKAGASRTPPPDTRAHAIQAADISLPSEAPVKRSRGRAESTVPRNPVTKTAATKTAKADTEARVTPTAKPPKPPAAPVEVTHSTNGGSSSPVVPPPNEADEELRIARSKMNLELYDQAFVTLSGVVAKSPTSPQAVDARFLMASIEERRGKLDDAIGTYLEVVARTPNSPRAPEALYLMGTTMLRSNRSNKERDARRLFTELAEKYPASAWAPRGLIARGDLEERQKQRQFDQVLGGEVPSAIVSYRQVADNYPSSPERPAALWKLGEAYADMKRYDLAVRAFSELGERYPADVHDAWFVAGELYERRLKDPVNAKAAYARVPQTSPKFKDAQKRLAR